MPDLAHIADTGPEDSVGGRVRLEHYPQRLRVRIAGRVVRTKICPPGSPSLYEAVLEVEKSRPLPPISVHALSGIPVVEVIGDDLDSTPEIAADTDELDTDDNGLTEEAHTFPRYRVHRHSIKPAPLYPDYPPVAAGRTVVLIWHGQRSVPGVLAGTYVRCSGMLTHDSQQARIYNPRYEIVPLPRVAKK